MGRPLRSNQEDQRSCKSERVLRLWVLDKGSHFVCLPSMPLFSTQANGEPLGKGNSVSLSVRSHDLSSKLSCKGSAMNASPGTTTINEHCLRVVKMCRQHCKSLGLYLQGEEQSPSPAGNTCASSACYLISLWFNKLFGVTDKSPCCFQGSRC